jgi:hypothetical protein
MPIINHVYCEVRSMIRFLNAKYFRPAEICSQLIEVYREDVKFLHF